MEEIAKVVRTDGEYAIIKVDKKSECDKCGMCLFPKNANAVEMRAKNPVRAKEGDEVIFSTEGKSKALAIVLVFLVPLLLIGLSAIIAYLVIKSEIWMLILTILLLFVWFVVLSLIDKKIKNLNGFAPVIISILKK